MMRPFTGYHMLGICLAFFGTVIAVNIVMAVQATRTFGGTVVDNSYVASQHFNRWLVEAAAEEQRGWKASTTRRDGHLYLTLSSFEGALDGARVTAIAEHPLGQKSDVSLNFVPIGKGYYRSVEILPAGRWQLKLDVRTNGIHGRLLDQVPA